MDKALQRIATRRGCTYSRYADDLAFSGRTYAIDRLVQKGEDSQLRPSPELLAEIDRAGFMVNESKTRISGRSSCMIVTGLVVNERLKEGLNKSSQVW